MNEDTKIFDESHVECNECAHYWNDTCDGVPGGNIRPCTAYQASKSTDIPKKIEGMHREIRDLRSYIKVLYITVILHYLILLIADLIH